MLDDRSVSQCLISFKCSQWCLKKMCFKEKVCFKENTYEEITFHLRRILKRLCYYQWKAWYKLLLSSRLKKYWTHFYHPPKIFLRGTKYRAPKRLCSNTLKRNELRVYFSLKENKLACFTNSYDSFQVHDLVHDFWKKYHKVHVSLPWWCRHTYQKSQQTRHTKKIA